VPEAKIVTYDFLFERARESAARLAAYGGAELSDSESLRLKAGLGRL
jgi:hypothetical protein